MKKIISFFLASSISDVQFDRLAVGDFINQLNMIYEPKDIFIKLYKCENDYMDHSIMVDGSQKALDDIIKQSDLCFVIFWKKVGEFTRHELDLAIKTFMEKNRPKVVVYFKKLPENDAIPEEIKKVMKIIDEELLHYHREYEHIDSLKLGIITQLQVNGFIDANLKVENGIVLSDNQKLISTRDIPLFSDNDEYLDLLKKHGELREKREKLREAYEQNPDNLKLFKELSRCTKECARVKEDLDELTQNILDIGTKIAAITSEGKSITDNLRKAIKLFDEGDYDGVLEVLSPKDIDCSLEQLDILEHNLINERIGLIEEYRLRILALKAKMDWNEIHKTYQKAVAQVINRPEMPKTVAFEYAEFLFEQKLYKKCIDLCFDLIDCYPEKKFEENKEVVSALNNLLGEAYFCNKEHQKAAKCFELALRLRRSISGNGKDKNMSVAESCFNLAKLYYVLSRHNEAELLFNEALGIYRSLEFGDSVALKIAMTTKELALLYYQTNRHEKAALLYSQALNAYETSKNESNDSYENIQDICRRLAGLYCAVLRHKKTDRYFIPALKTKNELVSSGDQAFVSYLKSISERLCDLYNKYGYGEFAKTLSETADKMLKCFSADSSENNEDFINDNFDFYKAPFNAVKVESLCLKTLDIANKLSGLNPEAYEGNIAEACNLCAEFYIQTGMYDEAESLLSRAVHINEKLMSFDKADAEVTLATTYCNLGYMYLQKLSFDLSEQYYKKAIDIYKKFNALNAGSFDNEIARTSVSLGNVYQEAKQTVSANNCYFNALCLYYSLYAKSPKAFIDRVINTIGNIVHSLCGKDESEEIQNFLKAQQ